MIQANDNENPLLELPTAPFEVPSFARILPGHFRPAFARALAAHDAEIDTIITQSAPPSFDNTILALERSGLTLARVASVFYVLAGAHTNEMLLAMERELAPKLTAHWDRIYMNETLFGRIEALAKQVSELGLTEEQARVLDRYCVTFRRAGGGLNAKAKQRLAEISERLATLGTTFSQNVLADEQAYALVLEGEPDLAGLPDFVRAAARGAADERGLTGRHVVTLSRSSVVPFLQFSARRDLREKVFRAWIARGEGGGETDNTAIIAEMVKLRTERAQLLGYPTFAHYRLDDSMAKTPEAVIGLLDAVWEPARRRVIEERDALQDVIRAEGSNFPLTAADWRYYAEKLRKQRFDLGEEEIKPYLQLENVIAAAFHTANRLFGLTFTPVNDVPVYHSDVRVWDVRAPGGRHIGLFFGDYFARSSKRSGAWMTTLRDQDKLDGDVRPLVLNVMNFAKSEGEPTLLSFDDARTLFHEFGHGLHGLLSNVTYPMVAGTSVLRDFVELPSQLFEHWMERPEILHQFAVHYRTGEPMPQDLLTRLLAARTFNQGYATAELLASSFVDMDFHLLGPGVAPNAAAIEIETRGQMGLPEEVVLRHRPSHFQHVFSGDGYAAGYYSYLWSEVLDADAFSAFEETGDVFDPATAKRLQDFIYAAGGVRDPADAYTRYRGRLPSPEALLRRRGLTTEQASSRESSG
jgi:peptidyl-dipeptidase Dcp